MKQIRAVCGQIIISLLIGKNKCEGYKSWTDWGYEYDCGYQADCLCEDCIFNHGFSHLHGFFLPWKSEDSFFNRYIAPILGRVLR